MNTIVMPGINAHVAQFIDYLKALGLLRVVGSQKDSNAEGCWNETGDFVLSTQLTVEELVDFMLDDYRPSPIVSPWNRGFSNPKKSAPGKPLALIRSTRDPRFAEYQNVMNQLERFDQGYAGSTPAKEGFKSGMKKAYVSALNEALSGPAGEWLRTAWYVGSVATGTRKGGDRQFAPPNPIAGTGGNNGDWEIAQAYMAALVSPAVRGENLLNSCAWDHKERTLHAERLRLALLGSRASGVSAESMLKGHPTGSLFAIAQVGMDGCSNVAPDEVQTLKVLNPWDLILAVEGILYFASRLVHSKNDDGSEHPVVSAPFVFEIIAEAVNRVPSRSLMNAAAGIGSVDVAPARGKPKASDAPRTEVEFWLPIWSDPHTYSNLQNDIFRKFQTQIQPLGRLTHGELAVRIASLAPRYGISSFLCYRSPKIGKAWYMVRTEEFTVTRDPAPGRIESSSTSPLADVSRKWLPLLRRLSSSPSVGVLTAQVFASLAEEMQGSMRAAAKKLSAPSRVDPYRSVYETVGDSVVAYCDASVAGRLPAGDTGLAIRRLSPAWLTYYPCERAEGRLAAAICLASMPGGGTGEAYDVAATLFPLRRMGRTFLPVELNAVGRRKTPVISRSEAGYFRQMALNYLLQGNGEAPGVLSRGTQPGRTEGVWHAMGSDPRDVLAFLRGDVDDVMIVRCLAMLCATDFSRGQLERILPSPTPDWSALPRAYMLAKLFAHRGYVWTGDGVKVDLELPSSAVQMLGQGLYDVACRELWRRLTIVGGEPIGTRHNTAVQRSGPSFVLGPVETSRLLASLIFPLSSSVSFERYLLLHAD